MIATPAVDLRGGRCVQLVGGRPEDERVSLPDPVAVAADWRRRGFGSLHVVDLDAALGHGDNRAVVRALARDAGVDLQVGGGVRDEAAVTELLAAGARRVVVGTRAVDDPDWLEAVADRHPGRVTVAADVREGVVLRKGWTEGTGIRLEDLLVRLAPLPLAGVLCTDVGREGRMEGIDRSGVAAALGASPHPLWVSGGVTTLDELDFLAEHGAAGVVLGMALYTGTLDADAVASKYGTPLSPDGS
ncbi:MAG TPA: 1-(5-phosphoribosyl)-5-[(5-phosphoribosylamino)methylideneamino] imidazole-4-carboxamide isomerase [Longimicrobiales bacterium]|nr:1-(5-phosphoribosyl)-5-[(5-phosphoribosylamino)methylideneamino] imidazole-4-carboxamide isomerase [Longimicrobiales bacterium]